MKHIQLAKETGLTPASSLLAENGDTICIENGRVEKGEKIPNQAVGLLAAEVKYGKFVKDLMKKIT